MNDTRRILNKLNKLSSKAKDHLKYQKNHALPLFLMFFLMIFLGLNIFSSQNLSPIFFGIVNNDKNKTIDFLRNIRKLPEFDKQLKYFGSIYGTSINSEVFEEELKRDHEIKQLEQVLKKSYQSRDVIYRLYELYLEKGDKTKAEKYLKLAKKIDPNIN